MVLINKGVIQDLKDLLDAKVYKVVPGSLKKYQKGAKLLREWEGYEEGIDDLIVAILGMLQRKFHYDDGENIAGVTKLAGAITTMGDIMTITIKGYTTVDKQVWKDSVKFGEIFMKVLIEGGYVSIDRCSPEYTGEKCTAPWVIHPTHKWSDVIPAFKASLTNNYMGIRTEKPNNITGLFDTISGRPILKNSTDTVKFNKMLGTPFMDGLNVVRQTGWRINNRVLQFILNANLDLSYGEIPSEGSKKYVEKSYFDLKKASKGNDKFLELKCLAIYERESTLWTAKRYALKERSNSTEKQIILEKAKGLQTYPKFYYDIEVDYRGRIYNTESFLHYQSSDFAKGLLEFYEAKEMNDAGYKWLLRHIACSFNQNFSKDELRNITYFKEDYVKHLEDSELDSISVDKMSMEDRIEWSIANMEELLKIGTDGIILEGCKKPIVLLAACVDLVGYHKALREGVAYLSHLPIPVDGSNNGCQHTSAMNRDRTTGSKVGLTYSKIPEDLYVIIAKHMEILTDGFCKSRGMTMKDMRSCISKRATMTRAYSAGAAKIADSMFSDCYKEGATVKFNITARDCEYLSKKAVEAIDEVCVSNTYVRKYLQRLVQHELGVYKYLFKDGTDATKYMQGLKKELDKIPRKKTDENNKRRDAIKEKMKIATWSLVSGNAAKMISWETPVGFIADCELNVNESVSCIVNLDGKRIELSGKIKTERPDQKKHISAIAANMVHSMDSAHLVSCASSWGDRGKSSFGAVHDSFSVHASDVDELLVDIKTTFINLYEDLDAYQYFTDQIVSDTDGLNIMKPELGDLDLQEIHQSDFFFA